MANALPFMPRLLDLSVSVASGDALGVRELSVDEGISQLFSITLVALAESPDLDFDAIIGGPARFEIHRPSAVDGQNRYWTGVCAGIEQLEAEDTGLSTYHLSIVPTLWLASHRRNYRVFQDQSELDAALAVLGEWGISPRLDLSPASYPKRRYRTQYAESDFAFVARMLEDIGVAYYFDQDGGETRLVLADAPNRGASRTALPFVSNPAERIDHEWVTSVATHRRVRPGKYTQSDVDYRKPLDYPLSSSASGGVGVEQRLERYHHNYGSFLWKTQGGGGGTPNADDRGPARSDEAAGANQVRRRLDAKRGERRGTSFRTNAHDVRPGQVVTISGHPRGELAAPHLVITSRITGTANGDFTHVCEARYADIDHRPALTTPKPQTFGIESATVTGPAGEEIHTDELGRVRVRFHWDRQGASDETSSCWIPVSQPWAGAGFGAVSLPRVGQEVIVDFLGEDPDRPIVLGRVFTMTTPPPYELPKYKMVSGMRSESYPRPKKSGQSRMGGGPLINAAANDVVLVETKAAPTSPLGGGAAPSGLGGVEGLPAGGGTPDLRQIMPGTFGGDQAPQADLQDAVDRMRAPGPDDQDAGRSASGLVTDDGAGNEKLYLQGQHDFRIVVKNNFVGSVGGNRAFSVLSNDYEGIVGYQATKVGKDRQIEVVGVETHTVQLDVIDTTNASRLHVTKSDVSNKTLDGAHGFKSLTFHRLEVGKSVFHMTQDSIAIDAERVYINPGPELVEAALNGVEPNALADAQAREARIQKAMEAIAAHEMASRFPTSVEENSLRATARGAPTPFSDAVRRAGVTDPGEIREAAGRMADIMYGPPG